MKAKRLSCTAKLFLFIVFAIVMGHAFLLYLCDFPLRAMFSNEKRSEALELEMPFDQAKWRDSKNSENGAIIRRRMVPDLLKKHSLVGMTTNEIVSLLGTPDCDSFGTNLFNYPYGSGLSSDARLVIFIWEGKVAGYKACSLGWWWRQNITAPYVISKRPGGEIEKAIISEVDKHQKERREKLDRHWLAFKNPTNGVSDQGSQNQENGETQSDPPENREK
ncbi:MAG: hypothetical protein HY343_10370 [Lentisphaerae bacterium]|nr:hypothetical protein [Lentisphaerota bacterium]